MYWLKLQIIVENNVKQQMIAFQNSVAMRLQQLIKIMPQIVVRLYAQQIANQKR
jgi:hypothetical protein